jgi:hypothetical protein
VIAAVETIQRERDAAERSIAAGDHPDAADAGGDAVERDGGTQRESAEASSSQAPGPTASA